MRYIKHLLCILFVALATIPTKAAAPEAGDKGGGIDLQGILWGHILDSYEWHITTINGHGVILHLPVIVKSSTGWHVFSSSKFAEEKDANGNRPGPYGLYISGSAENENKICETVGGDEVRPFDISITKTVAVLFIDAILLLICVLVPARWCRKHKPDDPAPKGFTGLMTMFIMYIYDEVVKGGRQIRAIPAHVLLLHLHRQPDGNRSIPAGWGKSHWQHNLHDVPRAVYVHNNERNGY